MRKPTPNAEPAAWSIYCAALSAERRGLSLAAPDELWLAEAGTKVVYFLGFDNTYPFAIGAVAMLLACDGRYLLPEDFITNEFYELENSKFSTSRGHVVWGRDLVAEVPRDLPFEGVTFDVVYAFSVLTHLSERTAAAVLRAIRRRIAPGGLLALTVRPLEYWSVQPWFPEGTTAADMRALHQTQGFAFIPHHREPVEGEATFGDTSVSLEYIRRQWTEWTLAGHAVNDEDPYQLVVFLKPR